MRFASVAEVKNNLSAYLDHLHAHFVHPVAVERGAYRLPEAPGYSVEMRAASRREHTFPAGAAGASP